MLAETMFYVPTENRDNFWYESLCKRDVFHSDVHMSVCILYLFVSWVTML